MTPKLILLCYAIGYVATFIGTRFSEEFERTWDDVKTRAFISLFWPVVVMYRIVSPIIDKIDTTKPPKWL